MPVRELRCDNSTCEYYVIPKFEWWASRMTKEDPKCPKCGVQMTRLVSKFNAPWTGTLDRFKDNIRESFNDCPDGGHYAWRVKSSRLPDGGPEKITIRTRADQLEYIHAEHLVDPADINSKAFIDPDGKTLHTVGIAGNWGSGRRLEDGTPWLEVE
jgi:ssDNA-binding Zn-finger/Zn-ribbon topoisomerase 1